MVYFARVKQKRTILGHCVIQKSCTRCTNCTGSLPMGEGGGRGSCFWSELNALRIKTQCFTTDNP